MKNTTNIAQNKVKEDIYEEIENLLKWAEGEKI